jgi:hypothetical protein
VGWNHYTDNDIMAILNGFSYIVDLVTLSGSYATGKKDLAGSYRPLETLIDFTVLQKRSGKVSLVKKSTAANIRVRMLSAITGRGLSGASSSMVVKIAKDGDVSFSTITPTITDLGNGIYNLALTSTHTNTLGPLDLYVTAINCQPNDDVQIQIVAFDPQDLALGAFPTGTVVTNGSNSVTSFKTDLIQVTASYWNDVFLVFTSGALIEQVKKVIGFDGTTKFVTVSGIGFTGTPAGGDHFYLINK